ncbi:potassium uptake TrkH family protein [Haloactinospora alba]|uniref:Potassium uptake TrkH family protein n=1 Tax=Haloactinospora alba TaxID=405555 RepID=A0A543NHV8_9ACTN|nr:potassium transporter TrkG [Haloactinospora alba]TQN31422.1 potassium uptake TrkH family protein [Haloactinospora alba]
MARTKDTRLPPWGARTRHRARAAAARQLRGLTGRTKPPQLTVGAFAAVIAVGAILLSLPAATEAEGSAPLVTALFTATSSVCVTGLIVEDTPVYWSTFGESVIMVLIQIGGFGIVALATVLSLMAGRTLSVRMAVRAGVETKSLTLGEVRQLVMGILLVTVVAEAVLWLVLTLRLWLSHGDTVGRAAYLGLFHAVSAFNNAGFALYTDSLEGFATDPWITVPIAVAVVCGGLGFPVWVELWRHSRRRRERRHWTLHTKVTLVTTAVLVVAGFVVFLSFEWRNPATMGSLNVGDKLLTGFFQAVTPRTAGFNTLDFGGMRSETLLATDILMFVGGGSAGTAGGIKVTTFALLAFVIYANVRGEASVHVARRRVSASVISQATTVVLLAVGLVIGATLALTSLTGFTFERVLFEAISAFSTVGLSTGITGDLPVAGELIVVFLMFVGRLGPITLASALALRRRTRRYEYPHEQPIVG